MKRCTDQAVAVLPTVNKIFINLVRKCQQNGDVEDLKKHWQVLVQRCTLALQTAEQLQRSLCAPKSMRNPQEFKAQINAFINAYYNLAAKTKEVKQITTQLTSEVVAMLRPIQKRVQEVNRSITDSHWRHILVETPSSVSTGTSTPVIANGYPVSSNPAYGVLSPPPTVALPMTPASAALGPAVQATVPSTPGYQSTMFTGTVFERADAFLASQPSSALSSRTGTMTGGSFGGGVGLGGYGMANGNGMRNASDLGGTVKRV